MKRTILWTAAIALLAGAPVHAQTCGQQGTYAGVDLLFLSPKVSGQSVREIFYGGDNIPPGADFEGSLDAPLEFAQRTTIGYQGVGGAGTRFRWFSFDNELDYDGSWENGGPEIEIQGTADLDIDSYDFEVTQVGSFRMWNLTGAAGARYAQLSLIENEINFEDVPAFISFGRSGVEFEGAGPTVFIEGCRPVLVDGMSLFANCRTSILFGDSTEVFSVFDRDFVTIVDNDFLQVWEIQMGGRYLCPVTDNVDMVSGIFWEAQRWDSESQFVDVALHGFGAQFGFLF